MKIIILATVFAAVFSGFYAAPIFGQNGQKPTVEASKIQAVTEPLGKTPLRTMSISVTSDKSKTIDVQIMPSKVKGLKIDSVYWNEYAKALYVRVENEGKVESKYCILAVRISYITQGQPELKMTPTPTIVAPINKQTIYAKFDDVEPLQPTKAKLLFFDFKDFKSESGFCNPFLKDDVNCKNVMSNSKSPISFVGKKPLLWLEIITEDSKAQ